MMGNLNMMGNDLITGGVIQLSGKPWETLVLEYFSEGWRFRVKTSKGNRYITRRRGQEEKGMGRFTVERWGVIERLKNEGSGTDIIVQEKIATVFEAPGKSGASELRKGTPGLSRHEHLLDMIDDHLALFRGTVRMVDCRYVVNHFCSYWSWSSRPLFFDYVDEVFSPGQYTRIDIREGDRVEAKWVFRASSRYCSLCSFFKEK